MPEGVVRLKGGANNGASGLSGRRCSTRRECTVWVFSTSSTTTIEMPMLLPILRIRLNTAVPCVRTVRDKVAKLIVLSGTKTRPRPNPCNARGDQRRHAHPQRKPAHLIKRERGKREPGEQDQ